MFNNNTNIGYITTKNDYKSDRDVLKNSTTREYNAVGVFTQKATSADIYRFPLASDTEVQIVPAENNIDHGMSLDTSMRNSKTIDQQKYQKMYEDFTNILLTEECVTGYMSLSYAFIKMNLQEFPYETARLLEETCFKYFDNVDVVLSLLHMFSIFEFEELYPFGLPLVMMFSNHENEEINEKVVRVFEGWNNIQTIPILKNIRFSDIWLEDYKQSIIADIEEYNHVKRCNA